MVRLWDTSAVVPLVLREPTSGSFARLYVSDPAVIVWCLTPLEVGSAVCRKRREAVLGSPQMRGARHRLSKLGADWTELDDVSAVRGRARRLVEVHPLRTADAVQLASALVAVGDRPEGFSFVTLDARLAEAAEREGFEVLGATAE
ncbi:MAG TPA: type II toxin-antitoxin system VapC family toxin [Planctomycetota bacterium]|jgi:hypothetical protein|nr:type II toxin-antitoxin system VapC family toxin [Planctomycetota bacterium]